MAAKKEDKGWSTEKEIHFLSENPQFTLGTSHASTKYISRKEMLENYLEGARKRVNWGEMDRDAIISHATALMISEALK
jgi:hypothetical protein